MIWKSNVCDYTIVGTGTLQENHITRVFISNEYRGKGYGSYVMDKLEESMKPEHSIACLDSYEW